MPFKKTIFFFKHLYSSAVTKTGFMLQVVKQQIIKIWPRIIGNHSCTLTPSFVIAFTVGANYPEELIIDFLL